MIKAPDAIKHMQNQMIICNEFVEEAHQFNFVDFDLLDRINLKEVVVDRKAIGYSRTREMGKCVRK